MLLTFIIICFWQNLVDVVA